jgi:hypothetical protein
MRLALSQAAGVDRKCVTTLRVQAASGQSPPQVAAIQRTSLLSPVSDQNRNATFIAPFSSVSRAIFCASMTSPAARPPLGMKHQPRKWPSLRIQLVDVLLLPFLDAVALAGHGADDFEPLVLLVLDELLGGEPFFQECFGFGFRFRLGHLQGCQSLETGSRTR